MKRDCRSESKKGKIGDMEVQIAVAKTNKYAVLESGDTLEVVERPNGGLSVVLADGQTSGRGAKAVSMLVVRKVISLLAEGVRDGAAARAASDSLYTDKGGKVISTLNIVSIDLETNTLVLTRNNPAAFYIARQEQIDSIASPSSPLGVSRSVRPVISEFAIEPGLTVVVYTDGLEHAGKRLGQPMDVGLSLQSLLENQDPLPQEIADTLLSEAVRLDEGRPVDDISVVVLRVLKRRGDDVRRMTVRLPITVKE
jgi:serine phosphatase RsbU (regulator of sigma subunit)